MTLQLLASNLPTGKTDTSTPLLMFAAALAALILLTVVVVRVAQARRKRQSVTQWAEDANVSTQDFRAATDDHAQDTGWWNMGGEDESAPTSSWFSEAVKRDAQE